MSVACKSLFYHVSGYVSLRKAPLIATLAVAASLGGCAGGLGSALELGADASTSQAAFLEELNGPKSELQKATEHWGKAFEKEPRNAQNAINYARNLKAMKQKEQALAVLQAAYSFNPDNKTLNSEYGRLALELDQTSIAQKLLEQADDPTAPDWKTISARGTLLAKQGKYKDAIPHFERALAIAPNQPSVLNNLALAKAMDGDAHNAEQMLRKATDLGGRDARINQNLALVLGLQGKYDESKMVGGKTLPAESADANAAYVRHMVQLDPQSQPKGSVSPAASTVQTASTTKAATSKHAAKGKVDLKGAAPDHNPAAALADAHYAADQARLAKANINQPISLAPPAR